MLRVDPEKVEAQLKAMVASLAPNLEGSEPRNVLARMQSEVLPALTRWKVSEMNRGSGENDVLNAFVCLISSQLASVIGEVVGSVNFEEAHFQLANTLFQAIAEEVGSIMTGAREMENFGVPTERTH